MTTDQGQRRCGNGSNNHHRATRQERCDSLVAIPFPLLRLLARSLSESSRSNQGKGNHRRNARQPTKAKPLLFPSCGFRSLCEFQSNQGKGVPAMGATTITVSHKARPFRFPRCGFRSLCCGFWLVPFCQIRRHQGNGQPLEERKASRQGRSHQWKQQPSKQRQPLSASVDAFGNDNRPRAKALRQWEQQPSQSHKARTLRFPRCDSVPSVAASGSFPL